MRRLWRPTGAAPTHSPGKLTTPPQGQDTTAVVVLVSLLVVAIVAAGAAVLVFGRGGAGDDRTGSDDGDDIQIGVREVPVTLAAEPTLPSGPTLTTPPSGVRSGPGVFRRTSGTCPTDTHPSATDRVTVMVEGSRVEFTRGSRPALVGNVQSDNGIYLVPDATGTYHLTMTGRGLFGDYTEEYESCYAAWDVEVTFD